MYNKIKDLTPYEFNQNVFKLFATFSLNPVLDWTY